MRTRARTRATTSAFVISVGIVSLAACGSESPGASGTQAGDSGSARNEGDGGPSQPQGDGAVAPHDGAASDGAVTASGASTDQLANGKCPATSATKLTGTAAAGAACATSDDCAPICCGCLSLGRSFLGALCESGKCAPAERACATGRSATTCPNDGKDPATQIRRGSENPYCVTGTPEDCPKFGSNWTGSQCCITRGGTITCVAGDKRNCQSIGEYWTGTECCILGSGGRTCVENATGASCPTGTGGEWTGSHCCQ